MPPKNSSLIDSEGFISIYNDLNARFEHDENARALFNEVVTEMLSAFERKSTPPTPLETKKYFIWLLARKGFNFKESFWRDIDLARHQCDHRSVMQLSLDGIDASSDSTFSFDPRREIAGRIFLNQTMDSLKEDERNLIHWRIVEGRTLQEIARKVKLTPQGVKKRLDRIYSQVRLHLDETGS